ncbi:phage holin family protein [Microbacterium terregens]|uniref:Phage holin family protein n=1 Tax=Microbacterium terregens TaxID=69363 RepID=A0ABV5SVU6_9MICO
MGFLIRVVVNAFAIWVVTLIPALMVSVIPFPPGETLQFVLTLLIVAAIFALVNTIIGTVIKILAFPIYILTLGLIGLIINAFLLWLTAWITSFWSWGLRVEDFWWGVLAAIIISLINWIFGIILRPKKKD